MLSVVTDGSGECGFHQKRLGGVSQGRGVLNAKGTVGQDSGIEGHRCGVESRFRLFLDRVVMDMSDLNVSG